MYFVSRLEAGKLLTEKLLKYKDTQPTLVALSDGAVVVAAQVASKLKCPITLLLTEEINAPGEPESVASINQTGDFGYNSAYTSGQIDEFTMEYHQLFEQTKLEKLRKLNRLIGLRSVIRKDLLKKRTVILISDGLGDSASLESAMLYLKSVKVKQLIIATPFASVPVVDRMHLLADDIACLNVIQNFMGVNHYYEDNRLPSHEVIVSTVQDLVKNWK